MGLLVMTLLGSFLELKWIIKFPSHQTHLIQRTDVSCLRPWKVPTEVHRKRDSLTRGGIQRSVLPDFLKIRERTFTVRTIKHSFQNAGVWPVSFKAVQKKLERRRKRTLGEGEEGREFEPESEILTPS
jgi:hypothetical protein